MRKLVKPVRRLKPSQRPTPRKPVGRSIAGNATERLLKLANTGASIPTFILERFPGGRVAYIKKGGPFDPKAKKVSKQMGVSRNTPVLTRRRKTSPRGRGN